MFRAAMLGGEVPMRLARGDRSLAQLLERQLLSVGRAQLRLDRLLPVERRRRLGSVLQTPLSLPQPRPVSFRIVAPRLSKTSEIFDPKMLDSPRIHPFQGGPSRPWVKGMLPNFQILQFGITRPIRPVFSLQNGIFGIKYGKKSPKTQGFSAFSNSTKKCHQLQLREKGR